MRLNCSDRRGAGVGRGLGTIETVLGATVRQLCNFIFYFLVPVSVCLGTHSDPLSRAWGYASVASFHCVDFLRPIPLMT